VTPWTVDANALSTASVAMTQTGDIATFTWGDPKSPSVATAQVDSGVANFFPERSAQQTALMCLLGLLNP
jgi:hypothetical protein